MLIFHNLTFELFFEVRIGMMVNHDPYSISGITWKGITIHPKSEDQDEMKSKVEKYARELRNTNRPL